MGHQVDAVESCLLYSTIDEGRLKLVKALGSGSSGVVFLAVETIDIPSPRSFAVKCLIKAPPGSPRSHCQYREIAHHQAMSSHPHIVTLHRVIEEPEFIFLIMEYCPGGDLFTFLTDGITFSGEVARIKGVFLQIVDALLACHNKGIFHRDIKPENIFCNADGTKVYLGDFGLSTTTAYSQNFGVGSFSYMSPGNNSAHTLLIYTQAFAECIHYDVTTNAYSARRNDIWALGPILTIMISGRNPWRSATTEDKSFEGYLRDPNFLRKMLPISEGANLILRHIFTRKEKNRVSLEYLRQLVLDLDTFFMPPDEISKAGSYVREIAASYFRKSQHHLVYHETNTSYGHELGPLDERRICSPIRKPANDIGSAVDVELVLPRLPQGLEIQQINRSDPTNPTSVLSNEACGTSTLGVLLPAPPPKIYLPPRHRRGAVRSSPAASTTTGQVEAWSTGRVRRRVERVVE